MNENDRSTTAMAYPIVVILLGLLSLLAPTPNASAAEQDGKLVQRLQSEEPKVVAAALEQIADLPFGRQFYVPAVMGIAVSNNPTLARQAKKILATWDSSIATSLIEITRGKSPERVALSLKLIGRLADPSHNAAILHLIDHRHQKVSAEAMRALFLSRDPKTDQLMVERMNRLSKPSQEPDGEPLRQRHYGDVLFYCGDRPFEAAYDHLKACFDSDNARLANFARVLLQRHFASRFTAEARTQLAEAKGEVAYRRLDFILKQRLVGDRQLGIDAVADEAIRKFLTNIAAQHRSWCGLVAGPAHRMSLQSQLSIENLRSKAKKSIILRPQPPNTHVEFARGHTLDLPIDDVLTRAYRYKMSLKGPESARVLVCENLETLAPVGVIGIGHRAMGTWFGRERWSGKRIEIRFDRQLRPRESRTFGADGKLSMRVIYPKWLPAGDLGDAPQVLQCESPRMMLRSVFTRGPTAGWILNRSKSALIQPGPRGEKTLQALATAAYQLVKEKTEAVAPEKNDVEAPKR